MSYTATIPFDGVVHRKRKSGTCEMCFSGRAGTRTISFADQFGRRTPVCGVCWKKIQKENQFKIMLISIICFGVAVYNFQETAPLITLLYFTYLFVDCSKSLLALIVFWIAWVVVGVNMGSPILCILASTQYLLTSMTLD